MPAPAPLAAPPGYVLLIGYAILMFVPFAWSLITSFKTLPDSVQLTIIPDPFTLDATTTSSTSSTRRCPACSSTAA